MRRAAREEHPPCADLDEEERVDDLEPRRLDGDEVAGQQAVGVLPQEGRPGQPRPPRRGRHPVPAQHALDRRGRDGLPELEQFSLDPSVAPPRILSGQPEDQPLEFQGKRRSARAAAPPEEGPLAPDQLPVPAQERFRPDGEAPPVRPRQAPTERDEERAVDRVPPRALEVPPQHPVLVSEHEHLDLEGPRRRRSRQESTEQDEQDRAEDRKEHRRSVAPCVPRARSSFCAPHPGGMGDSADGVLSSRRPAYRPSMARRSARALRAR